MASTVDALKQLRIRVEGDARSMESQWLLDLLAILIAERDAQRTVVHDPQCICTHPRSKHQGVGAHDAPPCRHPNCTCTHYIDIEHVSTDPTR